MLGGGAVWECEVEGWCMLEVSGISLRFFNSEWREEGL